MEQVHIGHYILGKTIGTGGFGKVKEARHDLTGLKVAVKIINKRKMKNKNMISKVKRQIKILKFINHQNIIKLYEVLDTTNDIFVIMELAEGGELYDYIQNNDISQDEARFFFKQIISGVGYAHSNLIAHRDLKPENILIDSNRFIKIVDFGLSNLMKDGRLLKTACGSPNYAAPEIVGQRRYEGTSVDVWSCGVILYALLAGSLPFDEETVTLLYRKIEQGNYTIPNSLNPLAIDLIARMLQVDPYRRIRIHQIHNHPWIRHHIPLYAKIPVLFSLEKQDNFQLDEDIYARVRSMNFANLGQTNDQKIKKSIKKRDDESFVITYELLKDHKYRRENAKENLRKFTDEDYPSAILNEVENVIIKRVQLNQKQFLYGKRICKPVKILADIVIQSIRKVGIQYSIKNPQYCIKCTYIPSAFKASRRRRAQSDMRDQKQEQSEKQQKFTKKQIKFILQIYSVDVKGYEHMIDLQLTQGHPLVFCTVANKLYNMIDHLH